MKVFKDISRYLNLKSLYQAVMNRVGSAPDIRPTPKKGDEEKESSWSMDNSKRMKKYRRERKERNRRASASRRLNQMRAK